MADRKNLSVREEDSSVARPSSGCRISYEVNGSQRKGLDAVGAVKGWNELDGEDSLVLQKFEQAGGNFAETARNDW